MTRDERILGKIVLIIIGLLIIGYIFMVSIRMNMVKQPEGEYIRLEDAMILAEALDEELGKNEVREEDAGGIYAAWKESLETDKESSLTYGQFTEWLESVDPSGEGQAGKAKPEEREADLEEREGERAAIEELKREYKKKYQKEFRDRKSVV